MLEAIFLKYVKIWTVTQVFIGLILLFIVLCGKASIVNIGNIMAMPFCLWLIFFEIFMKNIIFYRSIRKILV